MSCTGSYPSPRKTHSAATVSQLLIIYGGQREETLNDMHVLNLKPFQRIIDVPKASLSPEPSSMNSVSFFGRIEFLSVFDTSASFFTGHVGFAPA